MSPLKVPLICLYSEGEVTSHTTVEEFVKSNNSRGTELQLKHDLLLTEFVWTHNNPRRTRYEQNTFRYSLSEGGFYKILPAINEPKKWR